MAFVVIRSQTSEIIRNAIVCLALLSFTNITISIARLAITTCD
jgi:hypothetical protein